MNMKPLTDIWEKFAQKNAEFYILTDKQVDYSSPKGQEFFYESGAKLAEKTFSKIEKYLSGRDRALEIGCGIGRLTLPHAKLFLQIYAVDISKTMLQKLTATAKKRSISNIKTFLPHEKWYNPESFDYAFSFIVFQHIENFSIIEKYIQRIGRALKIGGVAQLQFDTRPEKFFYKLKNHLPDFMLLKTHRKGIRRIRRDPSVLSKLFTDNGLKIFGEINKRTEFHTFLLRKP
jgi:SAM-dependent methyltransferase